MPVTWLQDTASWYTVSRVRSQMIYESHLVTWRIRASFLPKALPQPPGTNTHTWKGVCSGNLSAKNVREKRSRWEPSSSARTTIEPYTSVWRRLGSAGVDANRTPFGPVFWEREKDYSWRDRLNVTFPKDTGRTDRRTESSWGTALYCTCRWVVVQCMVHYRTGSSGYGLEARVDNRVSTPWT